MSYVYIIYSESSNLFYKGMSAFPLKRLEQHNNNKAKFTSNKGPWKVVFLQSFESKTDALKRERGLKKYSHDQIQKLIVSHLNELKSLNT